MSNSDTISGPSARFLAPRWLPEAAIFVVAFLARAWRLGYHSIWFDEAVSLRWARSNPLWIWSKTFPLIEDKHPPAYYLLLRVWHLVLSAVGLQRNDAALRFVGVLLGVFAVVGLYLLARRLSGTGVARWAALFAALSPLLVWYSQELRMFEPASGALIWGGFLLVRAWNAPRGPARVGWWLLMAAAYLIALYAYLFSAFALPAAGLSLLLVWHVARGEATRTRRLVEGVLAFVLVALLFLPLARNAWLVNGSEGAPGQAFADFGPTLAHLLRVFTVWRPGWPAWLETVAVALFGLLALTGLVIRRRGSPGPDRAWLVLWIGVPLIVGNLLLAATDTVFAEDRYFLFLAPFVLWAVARGVMAFDDWAPALGWATGASAAVALLLALPVLWTPALARENWRAAAAVITQQVEANPALRSAVISHVDYTRLPAEWYLRPRFDFDALPIFYPFGGTLREEEVGRVVAPPLEGLANQGYATIWLLQSHLDGVDDQRLVERWLSSRYPLITEVYPAGIKLSGYAQQTHFAELPPLPEQTVKPDVDLAPGLALAACEITTPIVPAADELLHPPSGWAHVRLWWQARGPIEGDYRARVRVADAAGVWGESLEREGDMMRRMPTSTWPADGFLRHEVDVNLNPVTPSGDYTILVRLLDDGGGEVGEEIPCGTLRVD